ncbi:MAG: DUF5060 domain-containing protein [Bacilli bacterium]|nr:DUF5060 domain-containing protein [Bacilli bacterium]
MVGRIKKLLFLVIACIFALVLVGCEVDEPESKIIISISGASNVYVGETITLSAKVDGSEEVPLWSSSDPTIATVEDGVVSGIAKGTVTIYIKVEDTTQEYEINVKERMINRTSLFCGVSEITTTPTVHEKVELCLEERNPGFIKDHYNPFDYNAIDVYGEFVSPSGKSMVVDAFWYRDYVISLDTFINTGNAVEGEPNGLEITKLTGDPEYRIRFRPDEAGEWNYKIYVAVADGVYEELNGKITVADSDLEYKGQIQVDKTNNRVFQYEDGSTFMPIGENIGWWTNNSRKIYDYYVWFLNSHNNNMNIARIWMATWGFCLHWGKSIYDLSDRLAFAGRLDRTIEYAEQFDIYVMLTLINHGQFSSQTNAEWASNPYNVKNGGILDKPEKFFTDFQAKTVYKNELKYILARYGYSDKIMCWELFNEVDWTDNAEIYAVNIKNWHKEMATFIRQNDPYNHMISTSYKTEQGLAFSLDEIDYVCPHNYGYANKNICEALPSVQDRLYNQYKKPVLYAEIGIDWENGQNNYRLDPKGISLKQASWAGMMGGGAGGAMNWWWDSYVHPYNLYHQFAGAGAYAKLLNLSGADYTQLRTLNGVTKSDSVGLIGYRFDNRIYGYVYDKAWKYNNATGELNGINVSIPFTDGNYKLTIYNTDTGYQLLEKNISVSGGNVVIDFPAFTNDIAFIIE